MKNFLSHSIQNFFIISLRLLLIVWGTIPRGSIKKSFFIRVCLRLAQAISKYVWLITQNMNDEQFRIQFELVFIVQYFIVIELRTRRHSKFIFMICRCCYFVYQRTKFCLNFWINSLSVVYLECKNSQDSPVEISYSYYRSN